MAVAMFDGKDICFTAFSIDETSESRVFYDWMMQNYQPKSVSTLYWGGEEIRKQIPAGIKTVEIDGPKAITADDFLGFNTIVRHPVTRPDLLPSDRDITSMTNEFFARCPARTIGVTGTKGKGTTATLISEILKSAGFRTHLIGNIGLPALKEIDKIAESDLVVFELSSFQLWDLKISPHIAVVLMVVAEHMDVHTDMREYVEAKSNIAKYQKEADVVVYHPNNEFSALIAQRSAGQKLRYQTEEGAHVQEDKIVIEGQEIILVKDVGLLGIHNLDNVCAAITAVWQYVKDTELIRKVISGFIGLEHRLEFVAEVNGVRYFNDSFATAPEPTMAAVASLDVPKILILGGSSKGSNFNQLARSIKYANMRAVITIGSEGPKIAEAVKLAGVENFSLIEADKLKTMQEIVARARDVAQAGDAVLLSPACASFDMFKNYKVRGKEFKSAVKTLAGE